MPSYLLFSMGLTIFVGILMSRFYTASDFYLNRKNCVRCQNLQFCTFSDFSDQCVFNISNISLFFSFFFFFIFKDTKSIECIRLWKRRIFKLVCGMKTCIFTVHIQNSTCSFSLWIADKNKKKTTTLLQRFWASHCLVSPIYGPS